VLFNFKKQFAAQLDVDASLAAAAVDVRERALRVSAQAQHASRHDELFAL
jgi:hypothetical protein